jgi:DNA excision repair protein ERCC-2
MNTFSLFVRDFALPVPRTGSIETHSGYGMATAEGQAIHLEIQAERALSDSQYSAEVKVTHEFTRNGYLFQVSGRMDGLFQRKVPKIEEIKSTFNLSDLIQKLSEESPDHPYILQLKTYGYFYWLNNKVTPELSFLLVSTRNREIKELRVKLQISEYESWLNRRLDELVREAKRVEKRMKRRIHLGSRFKFPFTYARPGQKELIREIEEGMQNRSRIMIQAPTGLGKTAGVLYPALKEALNRGQNLIYVTPKNSQHSVAEDAVLRFHETGAKVKSLTITAKSKLCFKGEPVCNPKYCEYAKDYYSKVDQNQLPKLLAKKTTLNSETFLELGEEFQVCPFELQMSAVSEADTIICDYNYVFAPRSSLERGYINLGTQCGKPNLVIDEAHNLPSRTMDYYSPALSSVTLEKMRTEISLLPKQFQTEAFSFIDECIEVIISCRPDQQSQSSKINPKPDPFLMLDSQLRLFLFRYLDSEGEIQPRDVIIRLCFYWSEFTAALTFVSNEERTQFVTIFHSHPTGGIIKIVCCDASEMLKDIYSQYEQVVAFSATLKPFEFYAKLSGLELNKLKTAEFKSPFLKSNRKVLIIPQVSTKYTERYRNYPKIAEAIVRISQLKAGNYFIFFPSFEFMERVFEIIKPPSHFQVLKQEREMKASAIRSVLDQLKQPGTQTLVFAVQGGVFSEGVDYPGKMIIGAFVIGPPLPNFDLEREEMKRYYEEKYGSGFNYAYTFPAMAKAVQSAGRVIRSETDRGIIILMDNRFLQKSYAQSMPVDWFDANATELVSNSILKEISQFWDEET